MKTLILTLDYELYGNGSGDVFKNIIEPTNHILSILRQYNIHISIFFEVVEYWKIKEEWDKGNKMGYENNPIEAINDQLRKAYVDGHDIQLHIHPQWVDAKYIDGKWHVNLNEWRLGDYHREGEYSLKNLLLKGKQTIEDNLMDTIKSKIIADNNRIIAILLYKSPESFRINDIYGKNALSLMLKDYIFNL